MSRARNPTVVLRTTCTWWTNLRLAASRLVLRVILGCTYSYRYHTRVAHSCPHGTSTGPYEYLYDPYLRSRSLVLPSGRGRSYQPYSWSSVLLPLHVGTTASMYSTSVPAASLLVPRVTSLNTSVPCKPYLRIKCASSVFSRTTTFVP